MKFVSPGWLWCLLLAVPLYGLLLWDARRRKERFMRFARPEVWASIAPELDWGARTRKGRLWLLAMAFLVLALARPQWGTNEETVPLTGLDVMIALDVSNSMEVEDVVPSRLKQARHFIRRLTERIEGDRVGIVAFAASSYVAVPLTTDLDYVREVVEITGPSSVSNQGTDIGIALETAARSLDRGAEDPSRKGSDMPSRAVILISDGEDHEEKAVEGAKALKESGTKLYIFGVGTQKGGLIPARDGDGQLHGYKRDSRGQPIVSAFKPDALMGVAGAAGGRYWSLTAADSELEELLEEMGALNRTELAERRVVTYEDRFYFPLAVALLLLIWEVSLMARARVAAGASAVISFAAAGVLLAAATSAQAAQAPVDAYLENEKGIESYKEGKIDEARKRFSAAQARDPSLPELKYNQGLVQLQQGDVDGAVAGFGGAAESALKSGDTGLAGRSLFNLGGALTKKQDIRGAVRAYQGALSQAILGKDAELEADARKNLELLVQAQQKKKEQKKQQSQQQKESKDGKQDQEQQQESNGSQGGDEKKEGGEQQKDQQQDQASGGKQKQQEKNYQGSTEKQKKDSFRSLKLSNEDADRVMAEISSRERDLKAKMNKQRGSGQRQQKDW